MEVLFVAFGDLKCDMIKLKTFVLFLHILAVIPIDVAQSKCCVEFIDVKIPVKLVTSYYWTRSHCPRRAIVWVHHIISFSHCKIQFVWDTPLKIWPKSYFCVFPIRFKTKAGREFCVDPETTWVSGHVNKVDKRSKRSYTVSIWTVHFILYIQTLCYFQCVYKIFYLQNNLCNCFSCYNKMLAIKLS